MNSSSALALGGSVPPQGTHLQYPIRSMHMNHHFPLTATTQRYMDPFAPPNYYDVSLAPTQTANHLPPKQHPAGASQRHNCVPVTPTQRHNCIPLNATQRHNCDTFTAKHNDVKGRVERRISELNAQLQCAPSVTSSPWWDELAENYFSARSSILLLLPQAGRKDSSGQRYHLDKTPHAVLEFFKSLYEHQVSQVSISFKSGVVVTENPRTREIEAHALDTIFYTEHNQPQNVKVTTEGHMALVFTPQLKIQYLEFDVKSASEFVARKNLQSMNKGTIQEMRANSTCYGMHRETVQFLKMARVLESMQVMMARHKNTNSIPKEVVPQPHPLHIPNDSPPTHSTVPPRAKPDIPTRNHASQKNPKNIRKNRKRKLEGEFGTRTKRTRSDEVFEVVLMAQVEVMRHNLNMSGRKIHLVTRSHSNGIHSGMYPVLTNQMRI